MASLFRKQNASDPWETTMVALLTTASGFRPAFRWNDPSFENTIYNTEQQQKERE
jgi:hypothetical protein